MLSESRIICVLLLLFQLVLSYGTGILYSAAYFVLIPTYNLSVTWVSASGYIYVLVSIYTTVWVGHYGDLIVSRFGKRRILVFVGYFVMCIASLLLAPLSSSNLFSAKSNNSNTDDGNGYSRSGLHSLLVPNTPSNMTSIEAWYLMCQVIAGIGSSLFTIPFNSWLFESSLKALSRLY